MISLNLIDSLYISFWSCCSCSN